MTDIKERLRLVAQSPRSDSQLAKDALAEIERLEKEVSDFNRLMISLSIRLGNGHYVSTFQSVDQYRRALADHLWEHYISIGKVIKPRGSFVVNVAQ